MKLEELKKVVSAMYIKGIAIITILYEGKEYSCVTGQVLAIRRVYAQDTHADSELYCGYTLRSALQSLYDMCKFKNHLK